MRILFVDIDTLRADHMGCYGYRRDTTPNFDAIAQDGVRFDNYYCSDAPCLPSRAALVTGMFGIRNGAVGHGGTAVDKRLFGTERGFRDPIDENNLHNVFRKAGLHTASVSTFPERHSAYWFSAGFNETYNVGGGGAESGETVLPVAMDWLERNGAKDNWFLHVHLWDPHTPYRTPADYPNPFEGDGVTPGWITKELFDEHKRLSSPHGLNEINMYDDVVSPKFPKHPGRIDRYEDLPKLLDGYDTGVHYADMLIGKLFDRMREMGIYDDAAIIVTSDHGENLGELGIYSEHATADQPTCHIPMLLKWPGGQKGIADGALHYSLDLAPTVAELLGVAPYPEWDGASYAGTVLSGEARGRDSLVISQMAHVCQRSARFGDWLYIRTLHDGFHLFDREMLYNIKEDPHQLHDVKDVYPELCQKGAKIILDWHDEQMLKSASDVDPMWTVLREGGPFHAKGQLARYAERLRETGRAEMARRLLKRHERDR